MRQQTIGAIGLARNGVKDFPLITQEERFREIEGYVSHAPPLDFLCLPEFFATHGVFAAAPAERLGHGPASEFCAALAGKLKCNVVAGILTERDGLNFNTAVLFGRDGTVLAAYDKVHPAPNETTITPGDKLQVFEVDGVKVGMQICFDLNFPEGCRALAVQGADLIFWPTMWIGPTAHFIDCVMRTRAMENFCFLVASGYIHYGESMAERSLCPTGIVSWDGYLLAQAGTRPGLVSAQVDFDEPRRLQGSREAHFAARRPECYSTLINLR